MTAAETRAELEMIWSRREWHGLRRVRLIHGNGEVLRHVVRDWADEKGIRWTTNAHNPGITTLHPGQRETVAEEMFNRPFLRHRHLLQPPDAPQNSRMAEQKVPPKPPAAPAPKPPPALAPPPTPSEEDLFAKELARLDTLDPNLLRRRKGD